MPPGSSPNTGQKRKSQADEAEEERPIKHRASLACQSCRMRKVRCDVLANGSRCTNCKLDKLECIVLPSRRGKTARSRVDNNHKPMPNKPPETPTVASEPSPQVAEDDSWATSNNSAGNGTVPACVTFDDEVDNVHNNEPSVRDHPSGSGTDHTQPTPYAGLLTPDIRAETLHQPPNAFESAVLPVFIAPLSMRIPSEDLEFLQRKGALTVPEPELQVEILRAYLFSVHPFMPMLDYRTFVQAVLNNQADARISLLLFQAVMFAGLHSLPLPIMHRMGFESAKQARSVFFNRVRLLYEFDVEPDIAAVLQSLILMSSWYSKWDGRRDTWHWTGLAYDVARRMGLHRESPARCSSDKAHRFRKRLWWSLYIRDRMIALGTRRPMRIQDEDFDVSMLTLADFDYEPFELLFQGQTIIPDGEELRLTALMAIQLAKLCRIIGRIAKSQYTMTRSQPDQDVPHTVMIVSRRDETAAKELQRCDIELNSWFEALPRAVERIESTASLSNSCSEVHWTMLILTYQTTINVLHRAQALKPMSDGEEAPSLQSTSKSKVKDSARSLTKLSQNMLRQDQVRYLGLIGVTALIAAYLSHLLDISSADEDLRDASTFRLHQTLEVLQALRQIYASADAAVTFLASVSRKAGVPIPTSAADSVSAATGLLKMSQTGDQASKTPAALPNGVMNTPSSALNALGIATHLTHTPAHQTRIGSEGQILTPNGAMSLDPSTTALSNTLHREGLDAAQEWASQGMQTRAYNSPQFIDTTLGGISSSAMDGSIFDWDGGIDFGMDIAPLSFSYDFYSDALGLVDGRADGV